MAAEQESSYLRYLLVEQGGIVYAVAKFGYSNTFDDVWLDLNYRRCILQIAACTNTWIPALTARAVQSVNIDSADLTRYRSWRDFRRSNGHIRLARAVNTPKGELARTPIWYLKCSSGEIHLKTDDACVADSNVASATKSPPSSPTLSPITCRKTHCIRRRISRLCQHIDYIPVLPNLLFETRQILLPVE